MYTEHIIQTDKENDMTAQFDFDIYCYQVSNINIWFEMVLMTFSLKINISENCVREPGWLWR